MNEWRIRNGWSVAHAFNTSSRDGRPLCGADLVTCGTRGAHAKLRRCKRCAGAYTGRLDRRSKRGTKLDRLAAATGVRVRDERRARAGMGDAFFRAFGTKAVRHA